MREETKSSVGDVDKDSGERAEGQRTKNVDRGEHQQQMIEGILGTTRKEETRSSVGDIEKDSGAPLEPENKSKGRHAFLRDTCTVKYGKIQNTALHFNAV